MSEDLHSAFIALSPGLPGVAAATVGRIAFNSQAMKSARMIVNSGTSASAHSRPYYPRATFPFLGKTNLLITGQWINTRQHQTLLVNSILQCTHPFPFKTLYYTTQNSLATSNYRATCRVNNRSHQRQKGHYKTQLTSGPVDASRNAVHVRIDESDIDPFPDLDGKLVRRVKPSCNHHWPKSVRTSNELSGGIPDNSGKTPEAEMALNKFEESLVVTHPDWLISVEALFNDLAEDGYTRPMSPESQDENIRELSFWQADTLLRTDDPRYQQIWVSRVKLNGPTVFSNLLLLARDAGEGFDEDERQMMEVRSYEFDDDHDRSKLSSAIESFASKSPANYPHKTDVTTIPPKNGVFFSNVDNVLPFIINIFTTQIK